MKNKIFTLIVILNTFLIVTGQQFSTEFSDVSVEELKMDYCPIDSTADAFVIHDIGLTKFIKLEGIVYFRTIRQTRIKILNKSAYDQGVIEIPFYHQNNETENIFDVKAVAVNLVDGQIIKTEITKKDIYREDINKLWSLKKFAIPEVQEGTVIEFTYSIESPWKVHLREWDFQGFIPMLYNRFQIEITPFYEYHLLMNKYMDFNRDTVYTENDGFYWSGKVYPNKVFIWEMKDVPAFKDEAFITTVDDYIQKAEFQLSKQRGMDGSTYKFITTWEEAVKKLMKDPFINDNFGQYVKAGQSVNKKILEQLSINPADTLKSIKTILEYTKNNYSWNGYTGMTTSQSKKEFLKTNTGGAADINLFYLSLLKTAGIEAYPLLLSTRNHGKVFHEYPFLQSFNYVIVMASVDGKTYYLDATEPLLPFNLLPKRCLNGYGLRVKLKEEVKWFPLIEQSTTDRSTTYLLELDPKFDSIYGQVIEKRSGYYAKSYRSKYKSDDLDGLKERFQGNKPFVELQNFKVENINDLDAKLTLQSDIKIATERIGDKIFISPLFLNSMDDNPLKFKERYYPLDFSHTYYKKTVANIKIPDGYEIEYLPESEQSFTADNQALFVFNAQLNGQYIQVLSERQITTTRFKAKEYQGLKDYFQKIVDKQGEKIVLRKIDKQEE